MIQYKKIYILLFLAIIMIFSFYFFSIQKSKHQFEYNIRYHYNVDFNLGEYFYKGNKHYYASVQNLFVFGKYDSVAISFLKRQMIDPYLSEKQNLKYIPIYNRTSIYPVACISLSVGEDGVLNNKITQKLYVDDWYKAIKAYNLDEVKQEIEKITIRYPVFFKKNGRQTWHTVNVNEDAIQSENVLIQGDSLFHNTFNTISVEKTSSPRKPFFYPKYSITRKLFGDKDYIVGWGCRVVEYEIEAD